MQGLCSHGLLLCTLDKGSCFLRSHNHALATDDILCSPCCWCDVTQSILTEAGLRRLSAPNTCFAAKAATVGCCSHTRSWPGPLWGALPHV